MSDQYSTEEFHKKIKLSERCTPDRAREEAQEFGAVAAGLARSDRADLAFGWARAAASFALVIVGRDESPQIAEN